MKRTPGQITGGRKQKQRGATMILFTFLMVLVIVPVIGLAIDGSIVMWEKARLSAAVDAAALAAGRSLSVGQDLSSQQRSATDIAQTYFQANFQPGHMGTSVVGGQATIGFAQTSSATRTVTIQANVNVPLYFLRLLGFTTASLRAAGQASRRDVNIVMVLDRSGSMGSSCATLMANAQGFVDRWVDGRDQLGLVTFQTTGKVDYAPTTNFKSSSPDLKSVLGQLVCAGGTNSAEALSLVHRQIRNSGWQGALNVVVFFSDGYPTAMTFGDSNPLQIITPSGISQGQTDKRYGWAPPGSTWDDGTPVPDYNTLYDPTEFYNSAKSHCTSSDPLTGALTVLGTQNPIPNGLTAGVLDPTPISISSNAGNSNTTISAPNCSFTDTTNYGSYFAPWTVRNDIAYIPSQDKYNNPTSVTLSPIGNHPFRAVDTFYYGGLPQVRPDTPKGIVNSSFITADNAAYAIRYDPDFATVIYTIGLGASVNDDFMERVANDPRASSYDRSKPAGVYKKAPTASQLQAAFQEIASQVLRISQ
jgi:Flp pilus assembly protein TadG